MLNHLKKTGKPVIGCFPLYPPLELFDSMGVMPVVMWGLSEQFPETPESDRHLQSYTCSVARRLTELVLSDAASRLDGLFMYNACDTLRNLPEILSPEGKLPVHRLHVPMAPMDQTDAGAYLGQSVSDLILELEETYGTPFSEAAFRQSAERYARARGLCRKLEKEAALGKLSFAEFADLVHRGWWIPVTDHIAALESALAEMTMTPAASEDKPGVFLSGILPPPRQVAEAIEKAGLQVVGNDIAAMGRSYMQTPAADGEPGRFYHRFYTDHYPCPTLLYTGDRRVAVLMQRVKQSNAAAVIFVGEKFCEYEYFEFPYLEKKFSDIGVHSLQIDISQTDETLSAIMTRIDAFAEMIAA